MSDNPTWSQAVCEGNPGVDRRETGRGTTPLDPKDVYSQEIDRLRASRHQFERDLTAQMDREYGEQIRDLRDQLDDALKCVADWKGLVGQYQDKYDEQNDEMAKLRKECDTCCFRTERESLRARLEQAEKELAIKTDAMKRGECKECLTAMHIERDGLRARLEQAERASDEAQLRANKAEKNLQAVVNALCPQCGRSLPPDGDCYGCGLDRAQEQIAALRAEMDKACVHDHHSSGVIVHRAMWKQMNEQIAALRARETEAQKLITKTLQVIDDGTRPNGGIFRDDPYWWTAIREVQDAIRAWLDGGKEPCPHCGCIVGHEWTCASLPGQKHGAGKEEG